MNTTITAATIATAPLAAIATTTAGPTSAADSRNTNCPAGLQQLNAGCIL